MSARVITPPDGGGGLKVGFKDVTCVSGNSILLDRAIGSVKAGTITAVLGPSSSGKSVLLKLLAGRGDQLNQVRYDGDIHVDGKRISTTSHHAAYISQSSDTLIGVLTVREAISYNLRLRNSDGLDAAGRSARVNDLISQLHLESCADTKIGTFYMAGISGGEKRRTSVAVEMVYKPDLLIADEPTSGLDTTAAIQCVSYIKSSIENSTTTAGAIISIHQPNSELLSLFHNIVMLIDGKTVFCGTVEEAKTYFSNIGIGGTKFGAVTPTEHYLQVMDTLFVKPMDLEAGGRKQDYSLEFERSQTRELLSQHILANAGNETYQPSTRAASWWTQFAVLLSRAFVVAKRDYALYYLQYNLQISYGALIGVMFLSTPWVLDDRAQQGFSAIVWVMALNIYVFVFKTFYFAEQTTIYSHERANNLYSATASSASELASYLVLSVGFAFGWLIAYFMVGFPLEALGFVFLLAYVTTFTAESIPHFISQFTRADTPLGLIWTQGVILIFFMFSAGVFIRDERIPTGLKWLKDMSAFEHASDSFMAATYSYIQFSCVTFDNVTSAGMTTENATCTDPSGGFVFPCDYSVSLDEDNLYCNTKGTTVIEIFKGQDPDKWDSLLYLLCVGIGFRVASFILQLYPPLRIVTAITTIARPSASVSASSIRAQKRENAITASSGPTAETLESAGGGTLKFKNVKVEVKEGIIKKRKKVIIDEISAEVKSGRLLALMGPSGAGKTTLLNALAGMAPYAETSADEVTLAGQLFKKQNLGYVPQFDNLSGVFTVEETLLSAAMLRVSKPKTVLLKQVQELLETVGLASVSRTSVNKLAGGQKKLLSIAIGLVARPKVLFLDEPTTGLDSTAASAVVAAVKEISKTGRIIIMTLHQPSATVFDMIDDLIVLSKGQLAYYGSVDSAPAYFAEIGAPLSTDGTESIADQVINIVTDGPPNADSWRDAFENSSLNGKERASISSDKFPQTSRPDTATKMINLTKKILLEYLRDPGYYGYRTIANLAFGIFTGLMYYDTATNVDNLNEVTSIAFLWNWAPLYFALASVPSFCISRRQGLNGFASDQHTIFQYCLAQFIASMPFCFVSALAFIVPNFWLSGVNLQAEAFGYAIVLVWLMAHVMDAVNWNLIEVTKSNIMIAVTLAMVVLGSMFIFAGFFIKTTNMEPGIKWIPWTLPTKYGLEGALYMVLHGESYDVAPGEQVNGDEILTNFYALDIDAYEPYGWINAVIVLAFVIALRSQHAMLMWNNNNKLGSMAHFGESAPEILTNAVNENKRAEI